MLRSLGFVLDDDPDEVTEAVKNVERLPDKPIYFIIAEEGGDPAFTIVLDEIGECWGAQGGIDLSSYGFENYMDFRKRVMRNATN